MNSAIISDSISKSTHFLRLSDAAALVMLMSLPHCDDYGRIPADPLYWAMTVCPARKNIQQVQEILTELTTVVDEDGEAFLAGYQVGGKRFYRYIGWFKYQSFGSNYMVRAEYPHPVLQIVEPPVLGKRLCGKNEGFFSKQEMTIYNQIDEPLRRFLAAGQRGWQGPQAEDKTGEEQPPKCADPPAICADEAAECANQAQECEAPAQIEPQNASDLRKLSQIEERTEPHARAPASALALASSPSPSQASSPATDAHGAIGGEDNDRRGSPACVEPGVSPSAGGTGKGKPPKRVKQPKPPNPPSTEMRSAIKARLLTKAEENALALARRDKLLRSHGRLPGSQGGGT